MELPDVSIILPVFNRPKYLRPAIDSVLAQSFAAWELLIVDDGSDDLETLSILASIDDARTRVLRTPHVGSPAIARNAGLKQARGALLAFLDSDDVWMPHKLATQVAGMRARSDCVWSYTAVGRVDEHGSDIGRQGIQRWVPYDREMVERLLRLDALVATPTVMMLREVAVRLGGFDVTLQYGEDYDLWIRAAACGDVLVIDSPLSHVRVHAHNYSADRLEVHRNWVQLYDKFSRIAPDATTRAVARQRKVVSALTVATILAARGNGQAEARHIIREHCGQLLLQPRTWTAAVRLIVKLLIPRLALRSQAKKRTIFGETDN